MSLADRGGDDEDSPVAHSGDVYERSCAYAPTGALTGGFVDGVSASAGSAPRARIAISNVARVECFGCQPTDFSLSVATTHGWSAKCRLPGGVSDWRSFHIRPLSLQASFNGTLRRL